MLSLAGKVILPLVAAAFMAITGLNNFHVAEKPKNPPVEQKQQQNETWQNVVEDSLKKIGGKGTLPEIYKEVENHPKTKNNPNWQAKVRQILQQLRDKGKAENQKKGEWGLK